MEILSALQDPAMRSSDPTYEESGVVSAKGRQEGQRLPFPRPADHREPGTGPGAAPPIAGQFLSSLDRSIRDPAPLVADSRLANVGVFSCRRATISDRTNQAHAGWLGCRRWTNDQSTKSLNS
jgi:hypothetical protein